MYTENCLQGRMQLTTIQHKVREGVPQKQHSLLK